MATGMVLIIVSRNIDLSVGSVLGLVGYVMAMVQAVWMPQTFGLGLDQPYTWVVAVAVRPRSRGRDRRRPGRAHRLRRRPRPSSSPSAGSSSGAASSSGSSRAQTIAPLDTTFQLLGGGPKGSLGETLSWAVGVIACLAVAWTLYAGRRRRRGTASRSARCGPRWSSARSHRPPSSAPSGRERLPVAARPRNAYAKATASPSPRADCSIPTGIAIPVIIMIGVTMVMTFIATRRQFGRYVYAIGGNPDAAELGGIKSGGRSSTPSS